MKKGLKYVLLAVCMMALMSTTAFAANGTIGGSGTEDAPYLIEDIEDLKAFRDSVNAGNNYDGQYVKLTADINLSGEDWTPIGNGTNKFLGVFDGGDHTVSNLKVAVTTNHAGLFGYASVVKNVKLVNATVSGVICVGSLVGELENSVGTVDNCHVSGTVQITGENSVGGLVGKGYAKVYNSSVDGGDAATSFVKGVAGSVEEGDNVGGIIGHLGEGSGLGVSGSSAKNITVSGTRKIGGIVGTTQRCNFVDNCTVDSVIVECTATPEYADENASTTTIGGLIGNYFGGGTGGTLNGNTVKNVTFNAGNAKSVGAVVGGNRTTPDVPFDGVSSTGNTITNVVGTTNSYMTGVAKIGDTSYSSLQEAIGKAKANDTVTLLAAVTTTETVTITESITLDLNGNTIENTANVWVIKVDGNSTLTIDDSSADAKGTIKGAKGVSVVSGSNLIMENGNVVATGATGAGVQIYGSSATMKGGTITSAYGSILIYSLNETRGTFTMENGKLEAPIGIYAQGSEAWDNCDVTISGGEIVGGHSAIYWPAAGKVTITGGTLSGGTAVYLKSGSIEITGGTLIGNGQKADYAYVTSGYRVTGDALVIENVGGASGYEAVTSVSITGGTFSSANAAAVASYAATDANSAAVAVTEFITGGTYSDTSAEAYLAPDYVLDSYVDGNGKTVYGVEPSVNVSFDPGAGTGTMAPVVVPAGDYVLPASGFTAPEGKQFMAWNVNGVVKLAGATVSITADTTLVALWEDIGHTCVPTGWKNDKDHHWKDCWEIGCFETSEYGAHTDANNDGRCDTCNYDLGAVSSPKTGENSSVNFWLITMIVASAVCGLILVDRRRRA